MKSRLAFILLRGHCDDYHFLREVEEQRKKRKEDQDDGPEEEEVSTTQCA